MNGLLMNVPAMLVLTVGAYLLGVWVSRKSGLSLLHPFLIALPVIVAVLKILDIPYEFYKESNYILDFMLGPSVVALGYLLYEHRKVVMDNLAGITSAVVAGSIMGVLSVFALCRLFNLDDLFILSLEAKSVTSPIAMDITASAGGNVSLAAVSVVLCGFLGATIGPLCVRILKFKSPVSRGLAFGCSSHGLGTAKAIEMGAVEGAVSGLSIALMGLVTALIVPLCNMLLL